MNKLDRPPVDYIHRLFIQEATIVAVSVRGEVVLYRDSQRVAAVQVGEVKCAVLVGSKLLTVNEMGVAVLDTGTLELSSISRMSGGDHIAACNGFIVIGGGSILNVYLNESLVKCLPLLGEIVDIVLQEIPQHSFTMIVSIVTSSRVINKAYRLTNNGEINHICDHSPGFGYPLITKTCLNLNNNGAVRYIQASMEGKVSISIINGDDSFVFRPHRITLTDSSLLAQPVFSIANYDNVLVTGGDGVLGIWDINTKKRTSQIKNLNGVVTAIAMNSNKIIVAVCDAGVKNSDLSEDLKLADSRLFEMLY